MRKEYRNPIPTVDILIEYDGKMILIERKNPPYGYAIPGGFVDYGESLENAAVREAKEETGLDVELIRQFHTYSAPDRDPRGHTISTVFIAIPKNSKQKPEASDDAKNLIIVSRDKLPENIVFDHKSILDDYFWSKY